MESTTQAPSVPAYVFAVIPIEAAFLCFHLSVFVFILVQRLKGNNQLSHAFYTLFLMQCCSNYANYGLVSDAGKGLRPLGVKVFWLWLMRTLASMGRAVTALSEPAAFHDWGLAAKAYPGQTRSRSRKLGFGSSVETRASHWFAIGDG